MVGLNIPLRFIFKPSYSRNCININVSGNAAPGSRGQIRVWNEKDDRDKNPCRAVGTTDRKQRERQTEFTGKDS